MLVSIQFYSCNLDGLVDFEIIKKQILHTAEICGCLGNVCHATSQYSNQQIAALVILVHIPLVVVRIISDPDARHTENALKTMKIVRITLFYRTHHCSVFWSGVHRNAIIRRSVGMLVEYFSKYASNISTSTQGSSSSTPRKRPARREPPTSCGGDDEKQPAR